MKILVSVVLIATIAVLAIWPGSGVGGDKGALEEAKHAVYPLMQAGEEVCSVFVIPEKWACSAYPLSFWVRLCTKTERGGGRQFRVEFQNGRWAVDDECTWLESALADPVRQVRVSAPVSVALAREIVGSFANQLQSKETVSLVRVHRDVVLDENGKRIGTPAEVDSLGEKISFAKVQTAPVENMYEVLTSHRLAIVYAIEGYVSITGWMYKID